MAKTNIKKVLQAYADAWQSKDREAWLALFADNASITDPVGQPAMEGKEAIAGFYDRVTGMAESMDFQIHRIVGCGKKGALLFTLVTVMGSAKMAIDVIDIFEIDDAGKILTLEAYWDNGCMKSL